MSRLGVVVNPTAGNGRGRRVGTETLDRLRGSGHSIVNLSADSLAEASVRGRQAIVDGLDAIVVVGGDGMTNLGVNLVAGTSLPLGIVAVGTGNDVARSIGLPVHDVASSIATIDRALEEGGVAVDAVTVGDPAHAIRGWYLGVLSAGFDAAVNERANALTWPNGSARYVRAILQELRSLHPYDYKVTLDGDRVWESPGTLVAIANTSSIGGGLRIAPMAEFRDGKLEVVLVSGVTRSELLRVFPKIYRGRHVGHPAVRFEQARTVLIEPSSMAGEDARTPPPSYADGERVGPSPLLCEVHDGAVTVLAPQ